MQTLPEKQVLNYLLDRCVEVYDWIEELENKVLKDELIHLRLRILCDIFSVYLVTLVDGGKNKTISLKSYLPNEQWVKNLEKLEIFRKCHKNRHNRSAHESIHSGFFVKSDEILASDINSVLKEIRYRLLVS